MSQADFRCPHCAGVIKAPPSLEGEYGECPKCKKDVDSWPPPISRPASNATVSVIPRVPTQGEAVWYYMVGDKRRGPVSDAQLKALAESGSLRPTDLVWRDGMPNWATASGLPGLFPHALATQPPAVMTPSQPPASAVSGAGRETKECPFCSEFIPVRAKRCPVCGETVDVALRAAEEARREAREARREARHPRPIHYHDRRPTCPHALHLVLTILTLGFWLPIWIIHWIVVECS